MQRSLPDVELFFRLHRSLMFFVNRRLKVIEQDVSTIEAYSGLPPQVMHEVHEALLGHRGLIDAFADENPSHFGKGDLAVVWSWQHLVPGTFDTFRQLRDHRVFLSMSSPCWTRSRPSWGRACPG